MHYVIIGVDHPNTADVRNQTRAKHLEYLHRAHKDVRVKLAGPLLARDRESMTGSLLVVEADSEEAVERFAAGDPYRKVGLFAELTIRHWRWTVGNPGVASSEAT
ncbi:MAG TPA: YciI family protein [Vicinamibacterales bacterium]|nr:YciI family protein [Vicinamibacterales bacterium]